MVDSQYEVDVAHFPAQARKSLTGWRSRTIEGFDLWLRSQVYFEYPFVDLFEMWQKYLDDTDLDPLLIELERKEFGKIGPLSIQEPWSERIDSVENAFSAKPFTGSLSILGLVVDELRGLVPARSLTPLSITQTVERLPKRTNMGLPWFTRDRFYLGSYIDRAEAVLAGDSSIEIQPFVLGWRGQAGGLNPKPWSKQRDLQMADKLDGILGGRFVYPVLDFLRVRPEFAAWLNLDRVGEVVTGMLRDAHASGDTPISTDYSSFDQSRPPEVIEAIFAGYSTWFSDLRGLDLVVQSFLEGDLLTPDGIWTGREGGIPSGTVETNQYGTLDNFVSSRYIAKRLGVNLIAGTYLGDDAVNVYRPLPSLDEIEDVGRELNLDLNPTKQFVEDVAVHYLQNLYVLDGGELYQGGGIRSTIRALNGILNYERQRRKGEWNGFLASMRTIMQLENCKYHPAFRDFVTFVSRGDGRLIEYSAEDIARRAGGTSKIEESLGLTAFHHTSQDVSSLSSFATVQILNELR